MSFLNLKKLLLSGQLKQSLSNLSLDNRISGLYIAMFTAFLISVSFFRADGSLGYDGDTLILASQFIKLVNPEIFGTFDLGTNPKPLIMLIGGVSYLCFDNLILLNLTFFISFLYMINRVGTRFGDHLFVSIGMLLLASNPFILTPLFGADGSLLYLIFVTLATDSLIFENKFGKFLSIMFLAWLARPGVETVLFGAVILFFINRNQKRALITLICALFCLLLSTNVWRLSYQSYPEFQTAVFGGVHGSLADTFGAPFFSRLNLTLTSFFNGIYDYYRIPTNLLVLALATFSLFNLRPNTTKMLFLIGSSLGTAILATFISGVNLVTTHKLPELAFVALIAILGSRIIQTLESFFSSRSLRFFCAVSIVFSILGISFYGYLSQGKYEIALDGSGAGNLNWRSLESSRTLVLDHFPIETQLTICADSDSITFATLDYGLSAKRIDVVNSPVVTLHDSYDLYILRNQSIDTKSSSWTHLKDKDIHYYLRKQSFEN